MVLKRINIYFLMGGYLISGGGLGYFMIWIGYFGYIFCVDGKYYGFFLFFIL